MNNVKPAWRSKTILANVLILLLAVAAVARVLPLPADWAPWLVTATAVLNVALRLTTSSGIQGFAPMRAAPAPQDAPPGEAGAPSVAAIIARDNGLEYPEDHE